VLVYAVLFSAILNLPLAENYILLDDVIRHSIMLKSRWLTYPDFNIDSLSEGSVASELALGSSLTAPKLPPNGTFIVTEVVVANVLHAFTDLVEAIDGLPRDKPRHLLFLLY